MSWKMGGWGSGRVRWWVGWVVVGWVGWGEGKRVCGVGGAVVGVECMAVWVLERNIACSVANVCVCAGHVGVLFFMLLLLCSVPGAL